MTRWGMVGWIALSRIGCGVFFFRPYPIASLQRSLLPEMQKTLSACETQHIGGVNPQRCAKRLPKGAQISLP
jgi:hypothetical protein